MFWCFSNKEKIVELCATFLVMAPAFTDRNRNSNLRHFAYNYLKKQMSYNLNEFVKATRQWTERVVKENVTNTSVRPRNKSIFRLFVHHVDR